jgi:hypothetical protein
MAPVNPPAGQVRAVCLQTVVLEVGATELRLVNAPFASGFYVLKVTFPDGTTRNQRVAK